MAMKLGGSRSEASEGGEAARGGTPGKTTRTGRIQRRAAGGGEATGGDPLAGRQPGGGASLPGGVRETFESSLGADLGGVRVHTGGESAAAASAVQAQAFTVGNDIHFGAGKYQPDDPFGMHLLAHEVAHTQQQAGGAGADAQYKLEVSQPGDAAEVEADRAADAMVQGAPTSVGGAGQSIQRAPAGSTEQMHDDMYGNAADAHAGPAKELLKHHTSGAPYRWDAEPPYITGAGSLSAWLQYFNLRPPVVDLGPIAGLSPGCNFNGDPLQSVRSVAQAFARDAAAAKRPASAESAELVIGLELDRQKLNMKASLGGGGTGPGGGDPHGAHPVHPEHTHQEFEISLTKTGKHPVGAEIARKFAVKALKHGALTADVSGAVEIEFVIEQGKPIIKKFGTVLEAQLGLEVLKKFLELQLVAKLMVETERSDHDVTDRYVGSRIAETALQPKVETSLTGQIAITLPGVLHNFKIVVGLEKSHDGLQPTGALQFVIE